jgi:Ca-activated chloride channel family protein
MRFSDINILVCSGFLLPAIAGFYIWVIAKRFSLLRKFANKELLSGILPFYGKRRIFLTAGLRFLSVMFILIALAGPQWGFFWEENISRGYDILIALDTSKSMLANDVHPDRLRAAKKNIKNFINGIGADRVGLIAFSGQAFLQCPLTVDHDGLLLVLRSLGTESIPKGGTSIAEAIEEAVRGYKGSETDQKLLILITDGENNSGDMKKALDNAQKKGLMISSVGIGSSDGGTIKILNEDGTGSFLKDKTGNIVNSALDEETLRMIANRTGGIYVRASPGKFGLWEIYEGIASKYEKSVRGNNITRIYKERFQLFLIPAFMLLLIEILLEKNTKKNKG